ncbi:type II toxin-antitoxin system RelE/ParE family toxin [Paramaledivibacter caminithermalis]|jgi:plasmid stabilization system protein ParE|uniref:Plasmid stabilization system protein ParE n=1 Tax=Paramaledivibacter caminithermalis (strain DSM 15212 / CIP 107654 / DViRD3) TaxID=1121301 RepID=A0A1M6QK67_PARC5|nr:type II toxin-antitoxin system RelE/ParE family toxin [Paramaledivibacter caminithermalis]SHK20558.1 Plasmid stabilization system protein ParE [Paramaledivibacter caminithermalis DSM 15212]
MKYEIRYLPFANKDLSNIVSYIADELKAPKAAMDLIDAFDTSISRFAQFPYSCRVFQLEKSLENEYRILPVKNYLVLYVVKEQIVEIHRVIYAKMDLSKVIK